MAAIPRLTENSPTATLLRNSRLFSIPPRLPRPDISDKWSNTYKSSPTATTPYPTHQVLTTPNSSRHRGDWGLKRPMPIKSTAKSFGIKVHVLDTVDQVTEFAPAHAHVKTLKKLQELNLTITRPPRGYASGYASPMALRLPPQSAFDPRYDHVAPIPRTWEEIRRETANVSQFALRRRWKQRGPDLRQLPQAEFDAYLNRQIETQKHSFSSFLKAHYVNKQAALRTSVENEGSLEALYLQWVRSLNHIALEAYLRKTSPALFTADELCAESQVKAWMPPKPSTAPSFEAFITQLGDGFLPSEVGDTSEAPQLSQNEAAPAEQWGKIDQLLKEQPKISPQLASRAQRVESSFLSSIQPGWKQYLLAFRNASAAERNVPGTDSASSCTGDEVRGLIEYFFDIPETIPQGKNDLLQLATHPAAGLSYRRTAAILSNHAVFGPTTVRDPQRARTIRTAGSPSEAQRSNVPVSVRFGLAGLVINPKKENMISAGELISRDTKEAALREEKRGTNKEYVIVEDVHVNHLGRVNMEVDGATEPAKLMLSAKIDFPMALKRAEERRRQLVEGKDAMVQNPLDGNDNNRLPRVKPLSYPSSQESPFKDY